MKLIFGVTNISQITLIFVEECGRQLSIVSSYKQTQHTKRSSAKLIISHKIEYDELNVSQVFGNRI